MTKQAAARGKAKDRYRLGLIADTHDADDPLGVVKTLGRQKCDYNIHLGDIGGSPTVMSLVREYKRNFGDVGDLSSSLRAEFDGKVAAGVSPLRAYMETRLGEDQLPRRVGETTNAYHTIIAGMARLHNPILLRGNVDGKQLAAVHIQAYLTGTSLQLADRPRMIELGWLGLVLWPSWASRQPADQVEQAALTESLIRAASQKEMIVVVAHEQLFKGPIPAIYASRVAQAGFQQRSIPRFGPNPTWRCLMSFFRSLPPALPCYFAFGHVHDPAEVIAAGIPTLRNSVGHGLHYRLYGLAWRGNRPSQPCLRRTITQLAVGVDEIAVCEVHRGRREIGWNVVKMTG